MGMAFLSKVYSWGTGAKYNVPADTVGQVIEGLEQRDGHITKESFLNASRPEDAPTHGMFEWDDAKAAEKYRLVQSGKILNNLVVTVRTEKASEPITAKAVVNVTPEQLNKASFISVVTAMSQTDTREIVLQHAMTELQNFKQKYRDLSELAGVFSAIDNLDISA